MVRKSRFSYSIVPLVGDKKTEVLLQIDESVHHLTRHEVYKLMELLETIFENTDEEDFTEHIS